MLRETVDCLASRAQRAYAEYNFAAKEFAAVALEEILSRDGIAQPVIAFQVKYDELVPHLISKIKVWLYDGQEVILDRFSISKDLRRLWNDICSHISALGLTDVVLKVAPGVVFQHIPTNKTYGVLDVRGTYVLVAQPDERCASGWLYIGVQYLFDLYDGIRRGDYRLVKYLPDLPKSCPAPDVAAVW